MNNFQCITESPEKLADFLLRITKHCSCSACLSCPLNDVCGEDFQIHFEWLQEECE